MKIDSIKITNFRGYARETIIPFENLTVFIGKNDVGKSTVLEALDIFFNDNKGVIKMDKDDVNSALSRANNVETTITVVFSDLPNQIVIDSITPTSLSAEYLLNRDNKLEIVKKYKSGGGAKTFVKALHPTNIRCAELLLKKNADLKKLHKWRE